MTRETKLTIAFAALGWLVALASLGLNLVTYLNDQNIQSLAREQTPTYELDFRTFDPEDFPAEVLALAEPVKHSFIVSHRSGRKVEGLVIEASSSDVEISSVMITNGVSGTDHQILNGGMEVRIEKLELLPGQEVKGYITTKGVAQLDIDIAADEGQLFKWSSNSKSIWSDYEEMGLIALVIVVLLGFVVALWFFLKPALNESGILEDISESKIAAVIPVLFILAFTSVVGISVAEIFYFLMIVVLLANYKKLTSSLDKYLASK